MSARRSSQTTGRSNNKVSREAEREGRFQDVIDVLRAMMAEDADRNEEQGRKTLLKAHRSAKEVRHWGEIAKCWFHYFYDIEQTKECFFKAVEIAGDSLMVATVEFRIKEVDDEGRVVRHVIGHRMVPTRVYLHSLFAATLCLRGETDRQAEFMGRAEEAADNLKSSMHAFDQFDEETLLYFDRAESQLGWLHIARCWREDFDERQQALRCIAKAEELAKVMSTTTNWVEVAKFWMRIIGEPREARRCVAEAEKLLDEPGVRDYIDLAEGVAVLGDPELPVQYLDKAESLIDELSDWSAIAYTWEELGYFDRADRANGIGEYLSSKVSQEEYLANGGGYGRYVPGEGPY